MGPMIPDPQPLELQTIPDQIMGEEEVTLRNLEDRQITLEATMTTQKYRGDTKIEAEVVDWRIVVEVAVEVEVGVYEMIRSTILLSKSALIASDLVGRYSLGTSRYIFYSISLRVTNPIHLQYESSSDEMRQRFENHGEIKTFFDLIKTRGMVFVTFVREGALRRVLLHLTEMIFFKSLTSVQRNGQGSNCRVRMSRADR